MMVLPTCHTTSTLGLAAPLAAAEAIVGFDSATGAFAGLRASGELLASGGLAFANVESAASLFIPAARIGFAAVAGGGAGLPCSSPEAIKVTATKRVEASAPHLVLRFQNSAAIITGAIAAKPENANRIAISKMPCFSLRLSAIR